MSSNFTLINEVRSDNFRYLLVTVHAIILGMLNPEYFSLLLSFVIVTEVH